VGYRDILFLDMSSQEDSPETAQKGNGVKCFVSLND
jgi:hypothetical protein